MAYTLGQAEVPPARVAAAQDNYGDASAVLLYKSQYQETLTRIERRKSGTAAWIGTGIGLVTIAAAVVVFEIAWLEEGRRLRQALP
jgi:hypothetical protein